MAQKTLPPQSEMNSILRLHQTPSRTKVRISFIPRPYLTLHQKQTTPWVTSLATREDHPKPVTHASSNARNAARLVVRPTPHNAPMACAQLVAARSAEWESPDSKNSNVKGASPHA